MTLVETTDLTVRFCGRTALERVSCVLPADGVSVLVGRSGSGKTTFLRSLNRLNECLPDSETEGSVRLRLGGRMRSLYPKPPEVFDMEDGTSGLRRRVGMVFQTPNVLPVSVAQNLLLPLKLATSISAGEHDDRMRDALRQAGLWHDVADRLRMPATGLSGGQQQRLCLARALILEPEILLLDEPTASLDPVTARDIENLLLQLSEARPLILVSHGMAQARRLAARLVLFGQGRLRGILAPDALDEDERSLFADDPADGME